MDFLTIIAGVLFILFSLRYLRKGFAKVMGGDLLDWLHKHTRSRWRSFGGGIVAGTVMPSSTAMAFLSVEMSRGGKVAWPNVLSVLLGAQVGITALIQFLSLNLYTFAPLFLLAGGLLFLYSGSLRLKGLGQVALAFAFLLMAMNLIGGASREISQKETVIDLFTALSSLPMLLFFGAMILTFVLQSSTASIAVAIGLAAGGQVSTAMLLVWVLGANIGLCLTVLAAGWSGIDSRRLGISVLFIKLPLALFCFATVSLLGDSILDQLPGALAQQAAWTHTLFNLTAGLGVFLAIHIGMWVDKIMPIKGVQRSGGVQLDPLLLQHSSLAINAALRESLRIFDLLHLTRTEIINAIKNGRNAPHLQNTLPERSEMVMEIHDAVVNFLDKIDDDSLDSYDARMKDALDDLMREIPIMLRTLHRDLYSEVRKLLSGNPQTVEQALPIIREAADRCAQLMEIVAKMLMQENVDVGKELLERKKENSGWMIAAKRSHTHLPNEVWEIIDDFQQLNRRLGGVAYVYCRENPESSEL